MSPCQGNNWSGKIQGQGNFKKVSEIWIFEKSGKLAIGHGNFGITVNILLLRMVQSHLKVIEYVLIWFIILYIICCIHRLGACWISYICQVCAYMYLVLDVPRDYQSESWVDIFCLWTVDVVWVYTENCNARVMSRFCFYELRIKEVGKVYWPVVQNVLYWRQ